MLAIAQLSAKRLRLPRSWSYRLHDAQRIHSITTSRLDPTIRDFASSLAAKQPCFSLPSQSVRVLSEPADFYRSLLNIILRARKRIFLSSLYIGSSENELIDTLDLALSRNPDLHVYLTLDYNRSTRPGPSSPILSLLPLLRQYQDRIHISLFRSPKLKGVMAEMVPPRFNEGWGTWHAKIYGADDEVIISGANLNKSYFTDRQDRYFHFSAQPALTNYCFSFLRTISNFSYRLLPSNTTNGHSLEWLNRDIGPWNFQSKAESALKKLQYSNLSASLCSPELKGASGNDVLLFPVIQAGQFNIREEEQSLSLLFEHLNSQRCIESSNPSMDLTSGYFGLYKPYQDLVLNSSIGCDIIAASPKANGFYGSGGLSGLIPEGYTLLEQRFMRAARAAGRISSTGKSLNNDVRLKEWEKDGWTYHAKGIWLSPSPDTTPVLTLFGSTNLNSRSSHLDTELSFIMMTSSEALRHTLRQEVVGLRHWAVPWKGDERKVRWRTKAIVGLVGGML
ncbi:hypothetical protein SERLA73DRAFT_113405 [Serpula lacrymans var. lacrymans S7.3]|uniref:CDP-diacylglycerol--glycerol-3-phosphate 3-phosphatidyltransferase n=2 Tax=Serpula lacrymans var. lacrymans TaxID=341189 RepID=F8Q831_SERL3|nr:uncharacterized protein SERLADRAFT_357874 [Serpula lacrymans var. lacrymans S7.9]EGN95719.1 hypothetical protein SERLA73DRAFT_113405 [Serpula lacrymans var. lacrymans S7.3]EGO21242.1 hypothetical protein SERLADRAFT_357874 [Serpula lacrymans var. lacrymans S7.9]